MAFSKEYKEIFERYLKIARSMGWKEGEAFFNLAIASLLKEEKGLSSLLKKLKNIKNVLSFSTYPEIVIQAILELGVSATIIGDNNLSNQCFTVASKYFFLKGEEEKIERELIKNAQILERKNNDRASLQLYFSALDFAMMRGDFKKGSEILIKMAEIHEKYEEWDAMLLCTFHSAMYLKITGHNEKGAQILYKLGEKLMQKTLFSLAIRVFDEVKKYYAPSEEIFLKILINLGNCYKQEGNIKKSLSILKNALKIVRMKGKIEEEISILETLREIYFSQKDIKNAEYFRIAVEELKAL